MRWKIWVLSLSLWLSFGAVPPTLRSDTEVIDRIIAYVNDDIITLSELNERTKAFVAARQQNPFLREQQQSLEKIRHDMLNSLINERLAAQEVSRLNISVGEPEVDATIARLKQENQISQEAMEAQLRKEGISYKDFRQRIKTTLEQRKLVNREVQSKTIITDEMVEAYYESNIKEFQGKSRWRLQDIYLPFPQGTTQEQRAQVRAVAQQVLDRLKEGADFGMLAQRYSLGPGAEAGGDLGFFSKGELEPALERAIEDLEPGETTPAIETSRGLHIIKVTEVDRAPAKALDDIRENIRSNLYSREVDFRYREWLSALRERSYIKIVY